MRISPITLRAARAYIAEHHRHNIAPHGWRFGVALRNGADEILGVATAGQPVSRILDDGLTLEVTRVCTLGAKNASSMLYGAICRAAKALGYRRVITYTLGHRTGDQPARLRLRRGRARQGRPLLGDEDQRRALRLDAVGRPHCAGGWPDPLGARAVSRYLVIGGLLGCVAQALWILAQMGFLR